MSTPWVIKLPLAENAGAAVLLHVTPKGTNVLDLDLLATDGESAFKGKVRERKLKQLRHKNFDGSDEEWTAILKHVLVSKQGSGVSDTIRQNLEVACSISGNDPKASLSISIRTRVEDITQRLGSLELPQTPDTDDVDLFGWASQAIDQRDELEDDLIRGKSDAAASDTSITSLQAQLDDLVKAKTEHEDELLARFVALLNEKKLRLRELKRLMSTAQVDKKALERLEASLPASGSGSGKRGKKRTALDTKGASESDHSDGFEAMDVDRTMDHAKAADSDKERHTTEDETETESDNDDLHQPVTSQTERGEATSSRLPPKEQPPSLPPARDLPFTRQKQAEKESKALPPPADDDEETASEDDEL